MGSAQSSILSPEGAVTVLVVAGAIGLGYTQLAPPNSSSTSNPSSQAANAGEGTAKKGKKKKQALKAGAVAGDISEAGSASKSQPRDVPFPEGIPGQFDASPASDSAAQDAATASSLMKAKKNKKKKGKSALSSSLDPAAASPPLATSVDYSSETSVKAKPKNAKRPLQQPPQATPPASSSKLTRPLEQSTMSIDTDGSWTRVGSQRRGPVANNNASADTNSAPSAEPTTSDAGITPSVTDGDSSSPIAERGDDDGLEAHSFLLTAGRDAGDNRRTLAEKMLPKARKTGVDDMLETSDYPSLSRVMRVQPLPNEKPASGFSWGDYEDVRVATDGGENDADGEDDGWGVVTSKRSKRSTPSSSQTLPQKVPETLTKRQRQNAQKRDAEKAVKADGEAQRLAILAKHKRELEKAKMIEQYSGKSGGGKTPSGGMKATVDDRGKLVWE